MAIQDLFTAQINNNSKNATNDISLNPGTYEYSNFVFPSNLGASHLGHYMIININVPTKGDSAVGNPFPGFSRATTDDLSKVDQLRQRIDRQTPGVGGSSSTPFSGVGRAADIIPGLRLPFSGRHTRRIKDTVVLAMPQNNLIYTSENDFENVALTYYGLKGLAGVVAGGAALLAAPAAAAAAGVGAYKVTNAVGKTIGNISQLAGYPLNPRLEILFTGRRQRGFVFELLMSPVNEGEANLIQNIIRLLRFHSSPDIVAEGYFFVPPAEFDITFFKDGKENLNIPRINTCVLEKIEVDLAPTGAYAAFSTGHPVQTRLSLGFREIEVLHKARITQGF